MCSCRVVREAYVVLGFFFSFFFFFVMLALALDRERAGGKEKRERGRERLCDFCDEAAGKYCKLME